jgi:hypothetical protein
MAVPVPTSASLRPTTHPDPPRERHHRAHRRRPRVPLGIVLAGLVTQALSKYEIAFSIPIPQLVAFTIVAILAGLTAAIMPARRASRLNVLDALRYE